MTRRNPLPRLLLGSLLLMTPLAAWAQPAADTTTPLIDPEARAVLDRMAQHVAKAEGFSVRINSGYDAVQRSGQKIEFQATRTLQLQRPGHMRAEVVESNGDRSLVVFDGKAITAWDEANNVYAVEPLAGNVDQAIKHFVGALKMRLPLAMLLLSTAPAEIGRRVTELALVEETRVMGTRCDHIAGRTRDVDFQFWVEQGDTPLLHRAVLTYKNEDGEPQFRAQLADWNFAPKANAQLFRFEPPAGSSKIRFAAQVAKNSGKGTLSGDMP